jgi:glutathione S-transferase
VAVQVGMEATMAGDTLVLWGNGTVRTHRTLWLARELGIDYAHKPVHPRTGETRTPEFLKLNPRHKVPVLTHGALVLTESAAIMSYLTAAFTTPDHFHVPTDAEGRAKLLEWCFFIMTELDANGLYTMRRHSDLKDIYGDAPVAVRSAQGYFLYQLETMADRIKGPGAFLMGDRISIADILLTSCLDWARAYKVPLAEHLVAYHSTLSARPAYRETYVQNYPDRPIADAG